MINDENLLTASLSIYSYDNCFSKWKSMLRSITGSFCLSEDLHSRAHFYCLANRFPSPYAPLRPILFMSGEREREREKKRVTYDHFHRFADSSGDPLWQANSERGSQGSLFGRMVELPFEEKKKNRIDYIGWIMTTLISIRKAGRLRGGEEGVALPVGGRGRMGRWLEILVRK